MYRTLVLALCSFCVIVSQSTDGFSVVTASGYKLLRSFNNSALYEVQIAEKNPYAQPFYLLDLHGTRYEVGFAYGYLLADEMQETYKSLLHSMIPFEWEIYALETFLDWQYSSYLSKQLPEQYKEEMRGIKEGGRAKGVNNLERLVQRSVTIANFPGDIENDIKYLLENEVLDPAVVAILKQMNLDVFKHRCSFFAAWGKRTLSGQLYSMRNLDWAKDTGISKHKLVTVFHVDGTVPHVTLGFAGFLGALTGMSAQGLTVHEAGNDVTAETFLGFTWSLRLRFIMERAKNLQEAKTLWASTGNTLGMNHMVASAVDAQNGGKAAYAFETMAGYTAYFQDNDTRELEYVYTNPDTGSRYVMGSPLPQAVWRTNHAYDPVVRSKEVDRVNPFSDSEVRYMILHDSFAYYEEINKTIGFYEAINVTSILGDKGFSDRESFYHCLDDNRGNNVLSVTYVPKVNAGTMYVAFETGTGTTWRPACCGAYVQFDMSRWW